MLYEIQRIGNFFTDFSTLRHIPINLASTGTTSVPKVAGKSATIDCRRDAFSTTFIKSEMPELMVSNIEERVETQIVHVSSRYNYSPVSRLLFLMGLFHKLCSKIVTKSVWTPRK